MMQKKTEKMTETPAHGYSSLRVLSESKSNEYQHDRVTMILKSLCLLELRMKVASVLEGLIPYFTEHHILG